VATAGVPCRMVRNFGILNRVLFRPIRSDQYTDGPLELRRIRTANRTMETLKMINNNDPNRISKILFIWIASRQILKPCWQRALNGMNTRLDGHGSYSKFKMVHQSPWQILPSQQKGTGREAQIPACIFMIEDEILIRSFRHSGRPVAKTR
jgi:hypothetical protein